MESVVRAVCIYGVLLVLFRLTGNRSLGQISTFDFVLLLIISEAIQNGMVGNSYSLTNAFVLVITLVIIDVGLSLIKQRSHTIDKWLEGTPIVVVDHGRPLRDRMDRARVGDDDILTAARLLHGLERMEQVKYAVVERSGEISIVPRDKAA
jgi:uncharacterized membrane protein YcaP (DUF421 family)